MLVPLTNKTGKAGVNAKLIMSVEPFACCPEAAREIQRIVASSFLQTSAHTSKNPVNTSVNDLLVVLSPLPQFTVQSLTLPNPLK